MKITQYGYTERTQKYYPMPMGELKLCIIQSLTKEGYEDIKIRINHTGMGEVDEYANLKAFILADLNNYYEVNVLRCRIVHFNDTNEDILVVNIDEADEDEI